MTLNLQTILESKRALRRALAARPIGEKLRMLDALRERELAIRGRTPLSKSSTALEELASRGKMKKEENDLLGRMKEFALRVIRLFGALPKTTEAQIIGRQVLRSGTSVGANYREAYRARSKAEFIVKAGDCLREIEETVYWLELLVEGGIVSAEKLASLRQETEELTAIFVTILRNAK